MVLFISSGEIFIILLFILIFFGADKIPEFTRMMGKGVREFKKATDDIKREFNENTSGVMNDLRNIQNDLTEKITQEITEPVQESVNETTKTFEEYRDQYNLDYYYNHPDDIGSSGNEYLTSSSETVIDNTYDNYRADAGKIEPVAETQNPNGAAFNEVKPKTRAKKSKTKTEIADSLKTMPDGELLNEVKPKTRKAKPKIQNPESAKT